MPEASEASAAPVELELEGELRAGLGEGAGFTQLDWVRAAFRERLGFEPYPGTFNLALAGAAWDAARHRMARAAGIVIEPPPGFCAARCYPVEFAGQIAGAAVVPAVADYPSNKLEIVAPVALRAALGLREGDRIRLRLRLDAGSALPR